MKNQSPQKKRVALIRLLFVAALLTQVIQYVFVWKFGEPYPALTMPSFAGVLTDERGNLSLTGASCQIAFADGTSTSLAIYDLFSQAPSAYHDAMVTHLFSIPDSESKANSPSFKGLKYRFFPALAINRTRRANAASTVDPLTRKWLSWRLNAEYRPRAISSVAFIWHTDTFDIQNYSKSPTRTILGIREVALSE